MSGAALVRQSPAPLSETAFEAMKRQAVVLSKTELIPKALQGKPESIMLIGLWGWEHNVPLATAVQEVHVIENRPSPSAQLRLALIRRGGHEARFVETDSTKAVLRARRREYRRDPDGWVTVTYTIADARRAGLLDRWVEDWQATGSEGRKRKLTWTIGDDEKDRDLTDAPEWVHKALKVGDIRSKDNWQKYPADMLRARAAAVMARTEFSDVMAALDIADYTPEEMGVDVGQDLDEPAASDSGPVAEPDDAEEVDDAVVVEDLAPEPDAPEEASASPAPGEPPAAAPTPSDQPPTTGRPQEHPVPRPKPGERQDVTDVKWRRMTLPPDVRADFDAWVQLCGIPDTIDVSPAKVHAMDVKLDELGATKPRQAE